LKFENILANHKAGGKAMTVESFELLARADEKWPATRKKSGHSVNVLLLQHTKKSHERHSELS
jgi:hypothetical protein